MDHQRNHCTNGKNCSDLRIQDAHLSDSSFDTIEHFIPNQIAPDNWPYFEARCNPLCSKGINGTEEDIL